MWLQEVLHGFQFCAVLKFLPSSSVVTIFQLLVLMSSGPAPEVSAPVPALPPRYPFVPHSDMEPMTGPSTSTVYCPHCSLPVDYCEFGTDATLWETGCKPNILKNHLHLYPHLEAVKVQGETKDKGEASGAKTKRPEVGTEGTSGFKTVTTYTV
jgi:hypothetical protein